MSRIPRRPRAVGQSRCRRRRAAVWRDWKPVLVGDEWAATDPTVLAAAEAPAFRVHRLPAPPRID